MTHKTISGVAATLGTLLVLSACSGSNSSAPATGGNSMQPPNDPTGEMPTAACSIDNINQWVDDSMRDFYLYYDQVPVVNLADYDTPEALVLDLRVNPPDRFTNIRDAQTQSAFFDEGVQYGYGFSTRLDEDKLHFSNILTNSPMDEAGISRGDQLLALDGELVSEMPSGRFSELLGSQENPKSTVFSIIDGDDVSADILVTPREFDVFAVQGAYTRTIDGVVYGYLPFLSFIEPAEAQLDRAFAYFQDQEIDELVLDLRYNGGGRTSIAHSLASRIAGQSLIGEPLEILAFNDKYSSKNETIVFPRVATSLNLSRLAVITTGSTASSSEIVINSLRSYIDVSVIGKTTSGKPFQTRGRDLCGKRLNAVEIVSTNIAGQSVINGIEPDCEVEDDLTNDYTDNEGMLNAAVTWLRTGVCDSGQTLIASRNRNSAIGNNDTGMTTATESLHEQAIAIAD